MKKCADSSHTEQPDPLLMRVASYIEQYMLLPKQGTIIVAVSGGADSLCLLHMLMTLCDLSDTTQVINHRATDIRQRLHVAHLNHRLRGEQSEREVQQVAELARSWGLPVTIGSVNVPALARREHRSLEDAARTARYRFLREVAQGNPIAVAHHQDDQVETLLLHWLRGGGIHSMVGLQPRQQDIIRPLLCLTHEETLAYCEQHNLTPVEDASNNDTRFVRNRIRHELLPLLEQMNTGFRNTLLRTAEVMSVDAAWLDEQVEQHWPSLAMVEPERIRLSVQVLNALPLSLQRHTLRYATLLLNNGQSPLELRHYELIERLLQRPDSASDIVLHLPAALLVRRDKDVLLFEYRNSTQEVQRSTRPAKTQEVFLPIPGTISIPGTAWMASAELIPDETMHEIENALRTEQWNAVFCVLATDNYTVYVDAERVAEYTKDEGQGAEGLHVRQRQPGDRMQPLGMRGEKKLQDIFVDKHIPRGERDTYPLFLVGEHPVWIGGVIIDERVRLRRETKHIVRLRLYRSNDER